MASSQVISVREYIVNIDGIDLLPYTVYLKQLNRDGELIEEQLKEIRSLKKKVNQLNQKLEQKNEN